MGYTPVFNTVFTGTLHGKWPQTGVWLSLLAMADRNGCVDMSPGAIASDIGIDVDTLMSCIAEFCGPDPMSRTRDFDGRRLQLIDADRPWGWRIVNHAKYREKARLQSKDSARTQSGKDAERKHVERASPDVPRSPPPSPSHTHTKTKKREEGASRLPDEFSLTEERRAVAKAESLDPDRTFVDFCDYWRSKNGSDALKRDWDATWRRWCRSPLQQGGKTKDGVRWG